MINEVFIEGRRLDLNEGFPNLLTFQIDDIKDIGTRNTSFSKTLIFPGTANNNYLFGNIFNVNTGNPYDSSLQNVGINFNAAKQAECIIFRNHIQVFKGIIRVLKIVIENNIPEYECAVFGELGGLVNAIGRGRLQDLDFSAYDHVYDETSIQDSWDNPPGSGVFYPLADYGNVSTNKVDYDIRAFRPALYVKEYIEKIFAAANYTFECDLMNTARFKSLIIPHNLKSLQVVSRLTAQGSETGTQTIISNGLGGEHNIPQGTTSGTDFSYAAGVWTYTGVTTKTFTLDVTAAGGLVMSNGNMYIGVKKNGTSVFQYTPQFTVANGGSYSIHFTYDVTLNNGDTVSIFATRNGSGTYSLTTTNFLLQILLPVPTLVDITPGSDLTVNETIPKGVLQVDFLSSIIKLFNLYVYEDKLKPKFVNIKPQVDFYDLNVSGIVDWTYKMERGKPITITPMSQLNSRFYDFKFKADADYYNDLYAKRYGAGFGDYLFDSEFDFTNERSEIPLIFSATPLVGYSGVDKIVSTYFKLNAGVEDTIDTNIRILQSKKVVDVTPYKIKDGVADLATGLTDYGYAGNYDDPDAPANDIHFGVPRELFFTLASGAINVTQFNVYWSSYMAEITNKDSKLLTAFFKLTLRDIYDLDFGKFIYIDGTYFRLNKIEDWDASQPDVCIVELLKVINTIY